MDIIISGSFLCVRTHTGVVGKGKQELDNKDSDGDGTLPIEVSLHTPHPPYPNNPSVYDVTTYNTGRKSASVQGNKSKHTRGFFLTSCVF